MRKGKAIGLRKWSAERNLKGGRIVDMVYEFLQQQPLPIYVREITKYVNQYRETNSDSIYIILKKDSKKRFIHYCDSYWGLASKKYPEKFVKHTPPKP